MCLKNLQERLQRNKLNTDNGLALQGFCPGPEPLHSPPSKTKHGRAHRQWGGGHVSWLDTSIIHNTSSQWRACIYCKALTGLPGLLHNLHSSLSSHLSSSHPSATDSLPHQPSPAGSTLSLSPSHWDLFTHTQRYKPSVHWLVAELYVSVEQGCTQSVHSQRLCDCATDLIQINLPNSCLKFRQRKSWQTIFKNADT